MEEFQLQSGCIVAKFENIEKLLDFLMSKQPKITINEHDFWLKNVFINNAFDRENNMDLVGRFIDVDFLSKDNVFISCKAAGGIGSMGGQFVLVVNNVEQRGYL